MKKLIVQASILLLLFFGIYFSLKKVDWMTLFNVEKVSNDTEQKLGDLFWDIIRKTEKEIHDEEVINAIDSLVTKICESNNIQKSKLKVHVIKKSEVNAFALPNNRLVLYSELILQSENEAALCGVICHELAHIERNHVMKKLVKEMGLSVLIGMTAGKGGGDIVFQAVKLLSSTAYDRNLEKEADLTAVEYLTNAGISPESFAEFLYTMDTHAGVPGYFTWITTHPDSKERAEYILDFKSANAITKNKPVLNKNTWEKLRKALE